MQDGYVERFDQKISPCLRRSASRRQARPSLPVYDRKRITKEGDNNFPLWQRGNKGDFVNCRSSISNIEKSGVRIRPQAPDFSPQIEEEEIEKSGV